MATLSYRWARLLLAAAGIVSPAAGCGDAFVGGAAGGGTAGSSSGGGGTGGSVGDCDEGVIENCYSGDAGTMDVGLCAHGTRTCSGGVWSECLGEVLPTAEECDQTDNDCDDQIDEDCKCSAGETQTCYGGKAGTEGIGPCKAGLQSCVGDSWGPCEGEVQPATESCENLGVDDDCNTQVDDLGPCTTTLPDNCAAGTFHCYEGVQVCESVNLADELCDQVDNDCDGEIDESFPEQGACNERDCSGTFQCVKGAVLCVLTPSGKPELCDDSVDNDCDGVTDPEPFSALDDDFSGIPNLNWTLGTEWDIGGALAGLTAPSGFYPDPGLDTTPLNIDNRLAGVVIGGNTTAAAHLPYYLTSKVLDVSTASSALMLVFERWLNTDASPLMRSTVEVYDGTSWVVIWENKNDSGGFQVKDSAWSRQALNVTAFKNAELRVRFGVAVAADGGTPLSVGSWSIDDVKVLSCLGANP